MDNEILEAVEQVGEAVQHTVTHIPDTKQRLILASLGWVAGAVSGYFLASKLLQKKYDEQLEKEITEAKAFYSSIKKPATPEEAMEELHPQPTLREAAEAMTVYNGRTPVEDPRPDPQVVVEQVNIFTGTDFVWDAEVEASKRQGKGAFTIHEEEWGEEFQTAQLTYYRGDNVLADDKDEVIPNMDVVGDALDRFGHGTEDARVVFARNLKLETDFEIALHDGKYASEVLGFQHGEWLAQRDHRPVKKLGRDE